MAGTDGAAAAARAALEPLLEEAVSLPGDFLDRVESYVALLLSANKRLNLTRVVEPDAVARLHLLDALAALPLLDAAGEGAVIDLGSGGGVPAIPLALARPQRAWTLVDATRKKADALQHMVDKLGLSATVLAERAETLGRDPGHRERYGVVTARACAPLPVLVELALPLLAVGGLLVAWKGPLTDEDDELRSGRAAAAQLGGGAPTVLPSLPALGGHTFVVVSKDGATPERFPRRPGEPSRRPLG